MSVTYEDLSKILKDQNLLFADQWSKQLAALTEALETSYSTPVFPSSSSVPMPTFSGNSKEDVKEFLARFHSVTSFYKFDKTRKREFLPLCLSGNARIWFYTSTNLSEKGFDELSDALIKQFHTEVDVWLLRNELSNRKQLATERVAEFAADIRRLSLRINMPNEECINYFIQGLKPTLKHYVVLQRPTSFEDAEMYARLKESLPEPQPKDRTDEILSALAKLQSSENVSKQPAAVAAYSQPYNQAYNNIPPRSQFSQGRPLGRDDITEIVRQEIRRSGNEQAHGQNYRNRRTFDGRPICNYCKKIGHIAYACRRRQFDNRDPRIPSQPRQRDRNRAPGEEQQNFPALNEQHLNVIVTSVGPGQREVNFDDSDKKKTSDSKDTGLVLSHNEVFAAPNEINNLKENGDLGNQVVLDSHGSFIPGRFGNDSTAKAEFKLRAVTSEQMAFRKQKELKELARKQRGQTTALVDSEFSGLENKSGSKRKTKTVRLDMPHSPEERPEPVKTAINSHKSDAHNKSSELSTSTETLGDVLPRGDKSQTENMPETKNVVRHDINCTAIMTPEIINLNFESVEHEEQDILFDQSQIEIEEPKVSFRQIKTEIEERHVLEKECMELRHDEKKDLFADRVLRAKSSCSKLKMGVMKLFQNLLALITLSLIKPREHPLTNEDYSETHFENEKEMRKMTYVKDARDDKILPKTVETSGKTFTYFENANSEGLRHNATDQQDIKTAENSVYFENSAVQENGSDIHVANNILSIQLMSSQKTLINYESPIVSDPLDRQVITKGFPPPYTYRVQRKRKPPDKYLCARME